MKFRIESVAAFGTRKTDERYKEILKKYNYLEDDESTYINIDTLEELMQLERQLKGKHRSIGGLILLEDTITIYDDYIE